MIAKTPVPPYYAVIFTSIRTDIDEGYSLTADAMLALAEKQPGFLVLNLHEMTLVLPFPIGLTLIQLSSGNQILSTC